jgi:hypothetical protein
MRIIPSSAYGYSIGPAVDASVSLPPSRVSIRESASCKASIDLQLRALYDDLLRQPTPSHLVDLIETLAGAKGDTEGSAPFKDGHHNSDPQDVSAACVSALP